MDLLAPLSNGFVSRTERYVYSLKLCRGTDLIAYLRGFAGESGGMEMQGGVTEEMFEYASLTPRTGYWCLLGKCKCLMNDFLFP